MCCECYQVGGRFIAEDPDCPEHGSAASKQVEDSVPLEPSSDVEECS